LLDAQLLADVYLSLTSGQGDLGFDMPSPAAVTTGAAQAVARPASFTVLVRRASSHEQAAHRARLAALRKLGACLWHEDAEPTHDSESVVA
jgi:DNA polymerase-3 subunit epsilon